MEDDGENVVAHGAGTVFGWPALGMPPFTKVIKGKRQRETEKNIVGVKEYVARRGGYRDKCQPACGQAITNFFEKVVRKSRKAQTSDGETRLK